MTRAVYRGLYRRVVTMCDRQVDALCDRMDRLCLGVLSMVLMEAARVWPRVCPPQEKMEAGHIWPCFYPSNEQDAMHIDGIVIDKNQIAFA
ncbi:hypothetical protein Poli38472_012858 [Pythium oligandrum]|uniref:Uncharacterized protein n=1 Tax=Pythium oligandrum TaxID=41045 RepID=A0A8K1CIJ2_PYTOL|nr:hypothetical protein Poli38472_012858 [Pythium oligandrum]|eukprot:TMW64236.1 hypothetical protein Poli38472_012858 [Pythium oligandrum]